MGEPARAPWTIPAIFGTAMLAVGVIGGSRAILTLAIGLQVLFVAFFVRHLAFAASALRNASRDLRRVPVAGYALPTVSVLVACKNEHAVVEQLAASLLALDYPDELLQVIVCDDGSTDGTGEILASLARGDPRLIGLSRAPGSGGGKSGALNEALEHATGEIIVVFDADHQPQHDVLLRLVRHFRDPTVGAVQGRCVVGNSDDSLISRLVAVDYLGGYLVNEYGRQSLRQLPAYGGANCAVRASSLRALGGWNTDTVTEDTDLTLRLVLGGERIRYDPTAVDVEEGVVTLGRYVRQRYRWARGHQEVWRRYRRAVWSSGHLSFADKIELTMFLLVFHLPVAAMCGLGIFGMWTTVADRAGAPQYLFVLWTFLFLGPLLELAGGLLVAGAKRKDAFLLVLFLPLFFASMALCTKAWIDGILGRPYEWVKTKRARETITAPVLSGVP